jgi:hypothetical protein
MPKRSSLHIILQTRKASARKTPETYDHGISDDEWAVTSTAKVSIEIASRRHLIGCNRCWEFNERMSRTTARLDAAGEAMRHHFSLTDRRSASKLRKVLSHIRRPAESTPWNRHPKSRTPGFAEACAAPDVRHHNRPQGLLQPAAKGLASSVARAANEENWDSVL